MRKRDLLARIEALEKRVAQLEAQLGAQRTWPFVVAPDPAWYPIPKHDIEYTWTCLNTGYDPLTSTIAPYDKDYTYEGMLLEDRDAYAG